MNSMKLSLALAAILALLGCGKKAAVNGNLSAASVGVVTSAAKPYMGDVVSVCSSSVQLKSFTWKILNEDKFDIADSCTSVNNGSCLSCQFQEAGVMQVTLNAQSVDGASIIA